VDKEVAHTGKTRLRTSLRACNTKRQQTQSKQQQFQQRPRRRKMRSDTVRRPPLLICPFFFKNTYFFNSLLSFFCARAPPWSLLQSGFYLSLFFLFPYLFVTGDSAFVGRSSE
jgi:hypothetical protein